VRVLKRRGDSLPTTRHSLLTTHRGGQHSVAVIAAEAAWVAIALLVEELACLVMLGDRYMLSS
jgi:hypothetical protein